tara:strand:- start:90 stop:323 length:234 start_codon:yes stop_codon:yes gene_type:complete
MVLFLIVFYEISFLATQQSNQEGRGTLQGGGVPRMRTPNRMKFSDKCCVDARSVPLSLIESDTRAPGRHIFKVTCTE